MENPPSEEQIFVYDESKNIRQMGKDFKGKIRTEESYKAGGF
jgi:hypothetical protein